MLCCSLTFFLFLPSFETAFSFLSVGTFPLFFPTVLFPLPSICHSSVLLSVTLSLTPKEAASLALIGVSQSELGWKSASVESGTMLCEKHSSHPLSGKIVWWTDVLKSITWVDYFNAQLAGNSPGLIYTFSPSRFGLSPPKCLSAWHSASGPHSLFDPWAQDPLPWPPLRPLTHHLLTHCPTLPLAFLFTTSVTTKKCPKCLFWK